MKRKQIIVLGLVLVIIAVGILQYNTGGTGEYPKSADGAANDAVGAAKDAVGAAKDAVGAAKDAVGATNDAVGATDDAVGALPHEDLPGAAVYVDGEDTAQADQTVTTGADAALNGGSGFFTQARLDRDKSRSMQKEELKSLADQGDLANPATLEAQQELVDVINRSDAENTMESLIKQSGFDDAIVYMSDTGNIDVVVKASSLSSQQVAKISDIVVRHTEAMMENITVKNVD